jgi:peptidoglycan/LPS O-acetylase OafA/YrhL
MNPANTSYIPALTGIRALAAYLVFFHHFNPFRYEADNFSSGKFFGEFHIGVTFFFVLSGFLIHFRYFDQFEKGLSYFKSYMVGRIARIIPLFWVLTILYFIVYPLFNQVEFYKWNVLLLFNLTLLKGVFLRTKFSGIAQSWSLSVEFSFYFLAPFLFYFFRNDLMKYLILVILFFLLAVFLSSVCSLIPFGTDIGDLQFYMGYTFLGRSFEFFSGCYLSQRLADWKKINYQWPVYTIAGTAGIVLILYFLALLRDGNQYGVQHPAGIVLNNIFLPVFIVMLFRGLICESSLARSFFSSGVLQVLGKSSYAFYLVHVGIIQKGVAYFFGSYIWVSFIIMNGISILLYYAIEKPSLVLVRSKLFKMKS